MEGSWEDGFNSGINIGCNAVIKTLVGAGVLVELDGGVGFNGNTLVKGLSLKMFEDTVSDNVSEEVFNMINNSVDSALGDSVNE